MNRRWLYGFVTLSFLLLACLGTQRERTLKPYFRGEKVIKLEAFKKARENVSKNDLDLLKLWESIITGRSAPLPRLMKDKYKDLGLSHVFTPSGFHLSAVLFPFLKIIPRASWQFFFLLIVGAGIFCLPGMAALKRMVFIKANQKILGLHMGFITGLMLDILFGSFQTGALSFTYSFLFLSIIYSGLEGLSLIIWFFFGQVILSYFQQSDISLLLLLFSPLMNFIFGMLMPVLFLLTFPLWDWQLHTGIFLLGIIQEMINLLSWLTSQVPTIEVHIIILFMLVAIVRKKRNWILVGILLTSNSLNLDRSSTPSMPSKEYVPKGYVKKVVYREKDIVVFLSDGKCKFRMVRGIWWENCSPVKGSRLRD